MTSEKYDGGAALLASMGNDPNGLHDWQSLDPVVGPEIDRMLGEFCFGDVWKQEGLDLKTKRIITLTSLATQNRMTLLEGHIKSALQQGFERREILNVFVHLIAYGGFPTALSSIQVAQKVFADLDAAEAAAA